MTSFLSDSAIKQIADDRWSCHLGERWCVGPIPNGGYVMAIVARAMSAALPHKDPMSINGFYLAATQVGPAEISVEVLRKGGSTSFATARIYQQGALKAQFTASFCDLSQLKGETQQLREPPEVPAFDDCVRLPVVKEIPLTSYVEQRVLPGQAQCMLGGEPSGKGQFQGWVDFAEREEKDIFSLLLFADALPPPVFTHYGPTGWVPTIELTVQLRAKPGAGALRCEFNTLNLTDGLMEEDGYLWSADGRLLAISRQTAKFRLA